MTKNVDFFREKKPAAVFKHKLLEDYLSAWSPKLNLRNKNRGVSFVDGYAGQGRYDGSSPGSPAIAMQVARKGKSNLQCVFVEKDPATAQVLKNVIKKEGFGLDVRGPFVGDLESQLENVLQAVGTKPALFFLDPFGTALERDLITSQILMRESLSTELLLNFNIEAVWRMGGALKHAKSARTSSAQKTIEAADRFLGGDWWHSDFVEARHVAEKEKNLRPAALAAERVANTYADQISSKSGYSTMSVPIRRKEHQAPFFHLMLFYKHQDAKLLFADSAARAHQHWRATFWERYKDEEENSLTLFPIDAELEASNANEELSKKAVTYISKKIDELLQEHSSIDVSDNLEKLFGPYMGTAFNKDLRKAWKTSKLALPPISGTKLDRQLIKRR